MRNLLAAIGLCNMKFILRHLDNSLVAATQSEGVYDFSYFRRHNISIPCNIDLSFSEEELQEAADLMAYRKCRYFYKGEEVSLFTYGSGCLLSPPGIGVKCLVVSFENIYVIRWEGSDRDMELLYFGRLFSLAKADAAVIEAVADCRSLQIPTSVLDRRCAFSSTGLLTHDQIHSADFSISYDDNN